MSVLKGTNVASTIVPFTTEDTYATHDSLYGKGGYKEVATEQERDAIPETRLKEGTKVYVQDVKKEYRYLNGEWRLIGDSAGGGVVIDRLEDLSDVQISEATTNQVLVYDGSKWTNTDIELPEGGGGTSSTIDSLDDINDVDVASATANQVLMYDGEKWINADIDFPDSPDSPTTPEIELDEEVTEFSENPVKSSGIFSAINNMVNNKFVVLSESEYNGISHDAETFYFITK